MQKASKMAWYRGKNFGSNDIQRALEESVDDADIDLFHDTENNRDFNPKMERPKRKLRWHNAFIFNKNKLINKIGNSTSVTSDNKLTDKTGSENMKQLVQK